MTTLVSVLHIFVSILLVIVVLIQPSREGGGIAGTLGGSSQTIFGSSGGANFFTKFTSALAAVFMVTSLVITVSKSATKKSVFDTLPASAATSAATPAAPAATETKTESTPAAASAPSTAPAPAKH